MIRLLESWWVTPNQNVKLFNIVTNSSARMNKTSWITSFKKCKFLRAILSIPSVTDSNGENAQAARSTGHRHWRQKDRKNTSKRFKSTASELYPVVLISLFRIWQTSSVFFISSMQCSITFNKLMLRMIYFLWTCELMADTISIDCLLMTLLIQLNYSI